MIKKIFSFLFVLALATGLLFATVKVWQKQNKIELENIRLQADFAKKREEARKLNEINQDKKEQIQSINNNVYDVIEDRARKDYGMVREGETYYHAEGSEKLNQPKSNTKLK